MLMRKKGKMRMEGEGAHDSGCSVLQPFQQEGVPLLPGCDWTEQLRLMCDWRAVPQQVRDWIRDETHLRSGLPWRQAYVFCCQPMSTEKSVTSHKQIFC